MSFPADDIERVRELYSEGMAAHAVCNYMSDISLGTIRKAIGKMDGNIRTDDRLSTRQRQKYINQIPVPK